MKGLNKQGILAVDDIPELGVHVELSSRTEGWLRDAVQRAFHDPLLPDDEARVQLQLGRSGNHVDLIGGIYLRVHATCDRCLKQFANEQQIPLHMILSPATVFGEGGEADQEEGSAGSGEEECHFGVYEGRQIDLARVLGELVVLSQSMQTLCQPECKGLCPQCGKDLNEGPCGCAAQSDDSLRNSLTSEGVSTSGIGRTSED